MENDPCCVKYMHKQNGYKEISQNSSVTAKWQDYA